MAAGGVMERKKGFAVAPGAVGWLFWADTPSSLGLWKTHGLDLGTSALSLSECEVLGSSHPLPSQQLCLPGTSPRLPKISPPQSSHSSDCPDSVCRALPVGLSTKLYITLGLGLGFFFGRKSVAKQYSCGPAFSSQTKT